jgi:hypothetical protein
VRPQLRCACSYRLPVSFAVVKEVPLDPRLPLEAGSFAACLATVLELPAGELPEAPAGEDPARGLTYSRWLGRFGLGLARVAEAASFSWPGPWIALVRCAQGARRYVVMFGVPSGVVWDPAADSGAAPGGGELEIEEGFLVATADAALALAPRAPAPLATGRLEGIFVAAAAGEPVRSLERARALPGRGLEGDRHVSGAGTFPSGVPGSALTLIEAGVCESFDPPLAADEHRRNLLVRGIDLNALVGREFSVGAVRCRGMRLCEPCTVLQGYAGRPVLRALVHRGGLRADILGEGEIRLGDAVRAAPG